MLSLQNWFRSMVVRNGQQLLYKWQKHSESNLALQNKLDKGIILNNSGGIIISTHKSINLNGQSNKKRLFLKHIEYMDPNGNKSLRCFMLELIILLKITSIQLYADPFEELISTWDSKIALTRWELLSHPYFPN